MNIVDHIEHIVNLTTKEKEKIMSCFSDSTFKKGSFWIKADQVCRDISFIQEGSFRVYYYDENGNDNTCFFAESNSLISSYTSFLTETPSIENIVALEDAKVSTISKSELDALSDEIPKLHVWRRVVVENLFIIMEKRIRSLQTLSADERYTQLVEERPSTVLKIPLQYAASYLGISPQHLSRLRKNLAD